MQKVLVIGDAITDEYIWGEVNRPSPEDSTVSVLDFKSKEYRLGGCLNVAANLKSLNSSLMVNVYSVMGEACRKMLKDKSIDYFPGYSFFDKFCIVKTRFIDKHTKKQLLRLDNSLSFRKFIVDQFEDYLEKSKLSHYDAVVISDYGKGIINEDTIKTVRLLMSSDVPVFVDTKKSDLSIWDVFDNCFLKTNLVECQNSMHNAKHPHIVTMGGSGALLYKGGNDITMFKTQEVDNPEVTGCGDVFLAGLVVEYLRSGDLHKAIRCGNVVAGRAAASFGTTEVKE